MTDQNRADRAWSHLTDAFAWLKLHSHPSDVSGKRHRLAIYQAVMYLAKFTERPMSKARQRWVIGAQTIAAISSLLSNDMNLDLQERACAALANILSNCTVRPLADGLSRWAASLTPRPAAAGVGRHRPHRRRGGGGGQRGGQRAGRAGGE